VLGIARKGADPKGFVSSSVSVRASWPPYWSVLGDVTGVVVVIVGWSLVLMMGSPLRRSTPDLLGLVLTAEESIMLSFLLG
jgi:hypothetical protein